MSRVQPVVELAQHMWEGCDGESRSEANQVEHDDFINDLLVSQCVAIACLLLSQQQAKQVAALLCGVVCSWAHTHGCGMQAQQDQACHGTVEGLLLC